MHKWVQEGEKSAKCALQPDEEMITLITEKYFRFAYVESDFLFKAKSSLKIKIVAIFVVGSSNSFFGGFGFRFDMSFAVIDLYMRGWLIEREQAKERVVSNLILLNRKERGSFVNVCEEIGENLQLVVHGKTN